MGKLYEGKRSEKRRWLPTALSLHLLKNETIILSLLVALFIKKNTFETSVSISVLKNIEKCS